MADPYPSPEPIDPDVDLHVPEQRAELARHPAAVLGAIAASPGAVVLVGTGFCGALTTYSTFGWEVLRLGETGIRWTAVGYVLGSTAAGLAAAAVGWQLATLIGGR